MSASEAKPETFTRYIYVYRWKATGVPVYVGSAWNPNKRDKEHSRAPAIPFDRVITKHGRELFTLETVEAVQGETLTECWADSVPRENHWMDALKTWHEFGGQNFARATRYFDNEEQFKAWQAASAAAKKRRSQDPAWQATLRAAKARPVEKKREALIVEHDEAGRIMADLSGIEPAAAPRRFHSGRSIARPAAFSLPVFHRCRNNQPVGVWWLAAGQYAGRRFLNGSRRFRKNTIQPTSQGQRPERR